MIRYRATALTVTVLAALALAGCGTEQSPTTGEEQATSEAPDVLYAAGGQIHDGDTSVDVQGLDEITEVQRAGEGWVVAAPAESSGPAASDVAVVASDGSTTEVATIQNTFDVNADGTLLVASDPDGILRIYSTADGSVVKQWRPNTDGQENVSEAEDARFADGGAVVVRARDANGKPIAVRWEPNRGANTVLAENWDSLVTSDDGGTVAAVVGADQCLAVGGSSGLGADWKKCQWTAPTEAGAAISPDGESVLAAPAGTEGDLGEVAVLDVSDGTVTAEVSLPEGTTSATWADPDHLFVVSEESGGSTVSLCSLDGSCDTLAESAGPVVLGS